MRVRAFRKRLNTDHMKGAVVDNAMKERSEQIDILKGILILFVIIGHCDKTRPNGVIQIIYWFHMPCFFFDNRLFAENTGRI